MTYDHPAYDKICLYCEQEISEEDWDGRHSVEDREAHIECCEREGICAMFFSKPVDK